MPIKPTQAFCRYILKCVDWRRIRIELKKKYTKTENTVGNPVCDTLMMFKILPLETWYCLSDYELKECINDSLLFNSLINKLFWKNYYIG